MSTLNSETTFKIAAEIDALPLAINEKITLALIDQNPLCRNADLARAIGMSERGIKKLLQRLKAARHIQQVRKGRARRLLLTFHVEQGIEFPKTENAANGSNGELCSDAPSCPKVLLQPSAQARPLDEEFEATMTTIDQITRGIDFYPETVVRLLQPLIARIEIEMNDSPEKQKILKFLKVRQGAFMAVALGAGLPRKVQHRLDELIRTATPEQLIEFGERTAVTGNLASNTPFQLAEFVSDLEARHCDRLGVKKLS